MNIVPSLADIAARVTYALPFQDELVIGTLATLKVTPPKKFFLSPGSHFTFHAVNDSVIANG